MKKSDFNKKVNELCTYVKGHKYDDLKNELISRKLFDPVTYGMWCEYNFERNLRREDYKRKTTYTCDFSIAEWFVPSEGMKAIADTLKNALTYWHDDIEFFAEIIMVLCMKSNEHGARGNMEYCRMYADLYIEVKCLYFDWFDESHKEHDKAMQYYFDYVD